VPGDCPSITLNSAAGPSLAYLELTPACNNRCPGCINESFIADFQTRELKVGFHGIPLSGESWHSILERLPHSINSIAISGGEPTLHPNFAAIAGDLDRRGLNFVVFTNARWRAPSQLINTLIKLPRFQGFLISLHGATAESHDMFTGVVGSYTETLRNIRRAIDSGLAVTLSSVITRSNWSEIPNLIELATDWGVREIIFNRYLLTPDRIEMFGPFVQPPTLSQLRSAVQNIQSLQELPNQRIHIGYGPCIPQCFISSSSEGCSAGQASLVVDPWGNIKPCLHTDLLCGNLLESEFDIIWQAQSLRDWRGIFDNSCSSCSAFGKCGGGCRAMAVAAKTDRDPLMTIPLT